MKNKFITVYGIIAILILVSSVAFFSFSISREARNGAVEAEKSFSWIAREAASVSLSDGFMTDTFIRNMTEVCRKSRLVSAVVINTPSGSVFAWPDGAQTIQYNSDGTARITGSSFFMKVYSASLDIGDGASGSVVMTAAVYTLHPDAIFAASRNVFLVILALLFCTILVIMGSSSVKKASAVKTEKIKPEPMDVSFTAAPEAEIIVANEPCDVKVDEKSEERAHEKEPVRERIIDETDELDEEVSSSPISDTVPSGSPEGLFSPVTGTGWEQYLSERLDAELVRAASSEQDLSLIIIRIAGLLHTDLISRKVAEVLLETFRFRDMVFEYGQNGFAGILQNVGLDEAMKTAEALYAGIDSILMDMAFSGQITIGITTRTARLLPASRMIEEATSAARKAEEEPSLPIVAFRANPEKYRNFVVENN